MELEEMRRIAEAIMNHDIHFGGKSKVKYQVGISRTKYILVKDLVYIAFRAGISWEKAHHKSEQLTFIKE